ncbi:hypothetical protein FGL91_13450 [Microbacterium sp. CBA3102]|uniref:hypothetical protein n=1 Tax=Microbacterium sp. CBA3102 TaxID=2603598 RepID=UPI0011BAEFB6|nr:hypothetical protein [Microbacterium sp. CBA3102]QEA29475.1 hypothetical protein FGL91_13450 [Microbacterium sp. CBA3102]
MQRAINGERYCRACWRQDPRSFDTCSRCGKHATIVARRPQLVCVSCYEAPHHPCGLCSHTDRIATRLDGVVVCPRCYYGMRYPRLCPSCGHQRLLTALKEGQLWCAECAGSPVTFACPGCGSVTEPRKHRLCARCRRPIVARYLLTSVDGQIRPELQPLVDYLGTHHPSAQSLERWMRKSTAAQALREITDGTLSLDPYALIDRVGSPQTASFLLSLLVASGTIPNLDAQRARFEHWFRNWLPTIGTTEEQRLLKRYDAWVLNSSMRSTRRDAFQRRRSMLLQTAAFLEHIRSSGHTVATFPQRELDVYLTGSDYRPTRPRRTPKTDSHGRRLSRPGVSGGRIPWKDLSHGTSQQIPARAS